MWRRKEWFTIFLLIFANKKLLVQPNSDNCTESLSRPFYLVAHMTNSIDEVDKFLKLGANSIEIDLKFNKDGLLESIHHGFPCDFQRKCNHHIKPETMFYHLREISTPGTSSHIPQFNLAYLDLKLNTLSKNAKRTAGISIANTLIDILFGKNLTAIRLRIILGIQKMADRNFIYGFESQLQQRNFSSLFDRIGYDISGNGDVTKIETFWQHSFNKSYNVWQTDGITNFFSPLRSTKRLKFLVDKRESNETTPFVAKVCSWTVDEKQTMRELLRLRVDSMITNQPAEVLKVLDEPEFREMYHIAQFEDDPFCTVQESQLMRNRAIRNNQLKLTN